MNKLAIEFLSKYGMLAENINPAEAAIAMAADMKAGLVGKASSMPMIPTYLSNDGAVPFDTPVAVIDAGGTNFRSGLVTFTKDGVVTEAFQKWPMPGIEKPATWEEFISFVADSIEPLMSRADAIGFTFSYSAEVTPEIDGKVIRIDKEVIVTGCEGQLVGASLIRELEKRGITGKRVVILNDTAAVLLGGSAGLDKTQYSGFIGQVSGTGTNTCCVVAPEMITKLNTPLTRAIIINCESGLYDGFKPGKFDVELDRESNNPGSKYFEKMTAGVYLGSLAKMILQQAGEEGLLRKSTLSKVQALPKKINAAVIDNWSVGEKLDDITGDDNEKAFIQAVAMNLFARSARLMCTNLLAIMELTDCGKDKPVCVYAEGSLVQKSHLYLNLLKQALQEYGTNTLGRSAEMFVGYETTIPGSAAAALLN